MRRCIIEELFPNININDFSVDIVYLIVIEPSRLATIYARVLACIEFVIICN